LQWLRPGNSDAMTASTTGRCRTAPAGRQDVPRVAARTSIGPKKTAGGHAGEGLAARADAAWGYAAAKVQIPSLKLHNRRKRMKIAIASLDGTTISPHFGRSQCFIIFDVQDEKVTGKEVRQNTFTAHAQGNCQGEHEHDHQHSHSAIVEALRDCDAVLCYGMGWRAAQDLAAKEHQCLHPRFGIYAGGCRSAICSRQSEGSRPVLPMSRVRHRVRRLRAERRLSQVQSHRGYSLKVDFPRAVSGNLW